MNSRNHLIIISPGFPSDERDSQCLPAQQVFLKALNRNFPSLKITVIALQYPYRKGVYRWHGNDVISLHGRRFQGFLRPLLWMKAMRELGRIISREPASAVLSLWCQDAAVIGKRISTRHHLPHKIWLLGQDALQQNRFVRLIDPEADQLVALSESLRDEFEKNHGVRPSNVVPNGVDTRIRRDEVVRSIDLVGVGSLIPLKQFDIFLGIVSRLKQKDENIRAVLIGKGPEEGRLRALMKKLGVENNLELTGEVPHEKVLHYLQQSRILVHPSRYEGYSTVCLEALQAGCHVVSFRAAQHEVINHWHIVKDIDSMLARCQALLHEPALDHSSILVHDIDESAKKMMQLFLE